MESKKQILIKAYVLYILVAIVMVVVIGRVIAIQYGNVLPENAMIIDEEGHMPTKLDSIQPMRGRILADDGNVLVTSVPLYDLHMDLSVIKDELFQEVDSLSIKLAEFFPHKTKDEWKRDLTMERNRGNRYYRIEKNVKYNIVQEVRKFPILRESKFKGGYIEEKTSKRQKPYGLLAQRTLGSMREGALPVGLEGAFDNWLMGEYGLMMKQYVNGSWKPVTGDYIKDPVDGADIVTTIDIDIQDVAENELKIMLEKQEAVQGSAILMEVETGYIKAIANLTKGSDGGYYETFNHAVGTKTEPGSTFKLASLMALLEDGKADITDTVKAYGKYQFYDHTVHDSKPGGYGRITLQNAFEVSSNVFARVVYDAYQMEPQRFVDRLKSFGLGDTLGIDIAGEPMPILKNRGEDGWSGITLAQMAFGYEVEFTPLQILAFYNAVANNGELVKPQFVREIRQEGKIVERFEKIVLKDKICSDVTLAKVRQCLEGVVERGTGRNLKSANFNIAGKTGTAKIVQSNRGYGDDYQASFVGYFPAQNPKYSLSVVIAGPTKQIYGAEVSGTVFTAIANKVHSSSLEYHENFNLSEHRNTHSIPVVKYGNVRDTELALDKIDVKHQDLSDGAAYVVTHKTENNIQLQARKTDRAIVPDVRGMALNDAVYLLENYGLRVKIIGNGKVIKQSQPAGSELVKGTTIRLVLS